MTTAVTIAPTPILQFLDNNGRPCVGGSVLTQVGGVNTATYQDSAGTIALPNPIPLNNRGEVSNSAGTSCQLFLANGVTYVFTLYDAGGNVLNQSSFVSVANSVSAAALAASGGSGLVGLDGMVTYSQGTVGDHEQHAGRLATDAPWLADPTGVADASTAIQSYISHMNGLGAAASQVLRSRIPAGTYKLGEALTTRSNGGQSGIVGEGLLATVFKPTSDFTALTIATSLSDSGNFYIEWPSTVASSARVGIHMADSVNQVDQNELSNVRIDYSYRAFVTDPASQTMYLTRQRNLYAFRPLDWGFYYDMPNGSTTFSGELLYVRGDTTGGLPTAKGAFINNCTDVFLETCAFDLCKDQWLVVQNENTFNGQNLAFESNRIATAGASGVLLNGDRVVITGFKDVSNTYDVTSGKANVIGLGANTKSLAISGYSEQFSTVVAGTTKYKISLNSATTMVYVLDDSVLLTDIDTNGFFCNATIRGRRMSSLNQAPNYGTWPTGEIVWYATSTGGALGAKCIAGGSPGTWEEFGDLKLVGSKTWAPGAIANGGFATTPVTVTGARPGDFCLPSMPGGAAGCVVWANCEANDTVQVRADNNTGGSATPPSQTLSVRVFPQ